MALIQDGAQTLLCKDVCGWVIIYSCCCNSPNIFLGYLKSLILIYPKERGSVSTWLHHRSHPQQGIIVFQPRAGLQPVAMK